MRSQVGGSTAEAQRVMHPRRRSATMISTRLHALTDYILPLGIAALAVTGRFGRPVKRLTSIGPAWHLGYTALTRHEGGVVPLLSMRAHLACDAGSALAFLGAGVLMRDQPSFHRLLLAATGLGELALVALTSDQSGTEPQQPSVRTLKSK